MFRALDISIHCSSTFPNTIRLNIASALVDRLLHLIWWPCFAFCLACMELAEKEAHEWIERK